MLGTAEGLAEHYVNFHHVMCGVCFVDFDDVRAMLRHGKETHHFKCLRCPAVFEDREELKMHRHNDDVLREALEC